MALRVLVAFGFLSTSHLVNGFYLPGAAPRTFKAGEQVELFVNALTPMMKNEDYGVKSLINYDYYDPQFHFCSPNGGPRKQSESLGSILFGDRIFNSAFNITMLEGHGICNTLCRETVPATDAPFINERIQEDYAMNWIVDGLPAASWQQDLDTLEEFYEMGFSLGSHDKATGGPILNNHYDIVLQYHSPRPEQYRIVGVLVFPRSVGGSQSDPPDCSNPSKLPLLRLDESVSTQVRYSYNLTWEESPTPWATRWDNYLHLKDTRVHWVSLANASIFAVLLCVSVSTILVRSVSRDIARYNEIDMEEIQEDFGWKLVHGEVFRTPQAPLLLTVLVGNGAQLCAMVAVTLVFALLGFLSPSNRGSIATVMIVFWSFFGVVGGYVSARVYESLGGTEQRRCTFLTATALPTVIFGAVFFLNLFLIAAGSSGAVPFGTLMVIVLLWFVISAPLSAVGSYFGTRHGGISHPVRTNQIPRQIPPVPAYLKPTYLTLLAGILPFGAASIELYYVLTSIFASRAYYAFGFVSLTTGIFALTTAMVSILFTYFSLCAEEYRWHWRAFLAGGGSAVWVLVYGIYYWARRLTFGSAASVVLYFGYLGLLAMLTFLVTGTIGFLSTYWAVRRLYSSIRVD